MQLGWSFKLKSTRQYSHTLPLVQICGSLHLETSVKALKWPTMWWLCNLLMSHFYIHYPKYLASFLPECFCYWLLQRSEFPSNLAFKGALQRCSHVSCVSQMKSLCWPDFDENELTICFFPLWDWVLVTLLVWDFISCLSGTYYTLKMYSKRVSTGDFFLCAYSS